jgi:cytochrome oxidase Cu insertion factor (SCO1/SenC/PrrC family)
MPALATAGAGLVALSLWWRRTPWRILAAVVVVLLAGAQWAFMLAMGLPAYTGPVVAGRTFPAFRTVRADGTSFTENDLKGSQDSVLVFFRGRW